MCEYNEDELLPPIWLNTHFIEQVLINIHADDSHFKITALDIKPASQKGDHYASVMFRATVQYLHSAATNCSSISMIIKTLPAANTAKGHNMQDTHFFQTEQQMYASILPLLQQTWLQYGHNIKFSCKLLYAATTPQPVIVLEDLCASGYDVLRERLFNHDEVKACLHKLAKFHAVSHKICMEPTATAAVAAASAVTQMQHGLFKARSLLRSDYISGGMSCMLSILEEAGGFDLYLPKLRAMADNLIDNCAQMHDAFANGLTAAVYVLNHGDFHTKNIMIKANDNAELMDMIFIDFQCSFFGPSCYDTHYAAFTLLSRNLRDHKRSELLKFYFECFLQSLQQLEFAGNTPTYEQFLQDQKRWRCFEIFLISTYLPLTKLSDTKPLNVDINQVFDSAEYRRQFYANPDYIEYVREILPLYLNDSD